MNHVYKVMVASVGPLLYTARQNLAALLQMNDQMLVLDLTIALLVMSLALVFWCMCLYQMREMALKVIILVLVLYAALLSTHLVLVILQLMAEEHPDWHAAATATVAFYFNETVAGLYKSFLTTKQ
jgi:hypothetical protein